MDFDRWLHRFVTRIEKILFRLAFLFIVLLFVVQALLLNETTRNYISKTDLFEGEPLPDYVQDVLGGRIYRGEEDIILTEEETFTEEAALTIKLLAPLETPVELFLLVNGETAARLGEKSVYVNVAPGDLLEVTGEVRGNRPAVVKVVEVHGELKFPEAGHSITTFGDRDLLAWIIPLAN